MTIFFLMFLLLRHFFCSIMMFIRVGSYGFFRFPSIKAHQKFQQDFSLFIKRSDSKNSSMNIQVYYHLLERIMKYPQFLVSHATQHFFSFGLLVYFRDLSKHYFDRASWNKKNAINVNIIQANILRSIVNYRTCATIWIQQQQQLNIP